MFIKMLAFSQHQSQFFFKAWRFIHLICQNGGVFSTPVPFCFFRATTFPRRHFFNITKLFFFFFENRRLWSSLPSNSVLFLNTQNPKSHFLQDIFLKYLRKNPAAILRVPQRMWHYANLIKEVDFAGIYHICDVACCVLRAACGLYWGGLGGGGIVDCANM